MLARKKYVTKPLALKQLIDLDHLAFINTNIEQLQSRAQLDNIWIRAKVVRTAPQTIGAKLATQQLRAHRVLQEQWWPLDQEHEKVTVLGVS